MSDSLHMTLVLVWVAMMSLGIDPFDSPDPSYDWDFGYYVESDLHWVGAVSDWIDLDSAQHRGGDWGIEAAVYRTRHDLKWHIIRCDSILAKPQEGYGERH